MSYTKTTWETGDTVTAEKLNNMESGIETAISSSSNTNFVVTVTTDPVTYDAIADKTLGEIIDAMLEGRNIVVIANINMDFENPDENTGLQMLLINEVYINYNDDYGYETNLWGTMHAATLNDYPVYSERGGQINN